MPSLNSTMSRSFWFYLKLSVLIMVMLRDFLMSSLVRILWHFSCFLAVGYLRRQNIFLLGHISARLGDFLIEAAPRESYSDSFASQPMEAWASTSAWSQLKWFVLWAFSTRMPRLISAETCSSYVCLPFQIGQVYSTDQNSYQRSSFDASDCSNNKSSYDFLRHSSSYSPSSWQTVLESGPSENWYASIPVLYSCLSSDLSYWIYSTIWTHFWCKLDFSIFAFGSGHSRDSNCCLVSAQT